MRGGVREGAGGKKPKLPADKKRKKGSITLLPGAWERLRKEGLSQSKVVEKALEFYWKHFSL